MDVNPSSPTLIEYTNPTHHPPLFSLSNPQLVDIREPATELDQKPQIINRLIVCQHNPNDLLLILYVDATKRRF